jgi:hypothetical protein
VGQFRVDGHQDVFFGVPEFTRPIKYRQDHVSRLNSRNAVLDCESFK